MSTHSDLLFIDSNSIPQDLFYQQVNAMGGISKAIYKLLNNHIHTTQYQWLVLNHLTYNSNRVYLNPYHPCHLLLDAYEQWVIHYNALVIKSCPLYCRLLLQADQFVDIRARINLQCDRELDTNSNKRLSIDAFCLDDRYLLLDNITHQTKSMAFKQAVNQYQHQTGYTENGKLKRISVLH